MPLSFYPRDPQDPVPRFVEEQIRFMRQVCPHLDISVLAPHCGPSEKHSLQDGVPVYRFHYFWPYKFEKLTGSGGIMPALKQNPWRLFQIPTLFFSTFWALLRKTRKLKPDIIYAHWFTPQGLVACAVSLLTGTPFAFTSHSSDVQVWKKVPLIGPALVRFSVSRAESITVVSQRSFEKIKGFYTKHPKSWNQVARKIKILSMGVDTSHYTQVPRPAASLKAAYGLDESRVILFMGRLVEKKGVGDLISAFIEYHKANPSSVLVVAGTGPMEKRLKLSAEQSGCSEHIQFPGFISDQRKLDYLSMADRIVLPSIITAEGDAEGLPVVLMEALSMGKLCMATPDSGADDILEDGKNGFLIKPSAPDDILRCLNKIESMSEDDLKTIVESAKSTASKLDWLTIAQEHIQFIFHHSPE